MAEKKSRKVKISFLAFITLLVGAVGLFLSEIFKLNILGSIIQFLMFLVAAIVAYDVTKDGKTFFKSFYKISYLVSIIIVAVFIIIPFVRNIIALFS